MQIIDQEKNSINLLWTGGWDSTFQLLQLLLIYQTRVTPFYLIDAERKSVGIEIRTLKRIKDQLFKEFPNAKELLDPVHFHTVTDISPDSEITEAYQSIIKTTHLGNQYEWLARFCKEKGITDMQLSIEKPDSTQENYWGQKLNRILSKSIINSQTVYRVGKKFKGSDMYLIFQCFSFPIREITKIKMEKIADKHGWNNIMHMTWFCHNPTCNRKPCGICKPCQQIVNKGFGWRISYGRRVISFYYRKILWPLKSLIKSMLIILGLFNKKSDI